MAGQSYSTAKKLLEAKGFEVQKRAESSDTVPRLNVISTDPVGGSKAEKGSTVTVVFSNG